MTDLNRLTAVQAAQQISAGKLKSEDLVRACLDRIRERDADVRAWVHLDPDLAISQARAVDRQGNHGALAGVPVGVKDVIETADMPTQCNSPIYRDFRSRADAACVAMVRRAGGIILGKTVTTEFASRMSGPTRNPHNLAHTPGGSSSGSGAAVADFMVPFAFGTQTGGSTIRPAAYCGIVGYKPSFGTINCAGLKHLAESLDTIGVLGRSVADCALLVHAASSRSFPDLTRTLPRAPRVGLCRTSRWQDATPETQALLEQTASALATSGATVSEVALPENFDRLYEDQLLIMNYEAARALAWEYSNHADLLSDYMRATLQKYREMPRQSYAEAMRHARECRARFSQMMTNYEVLLTPSAPGEAPAGIDDTGNSLFNRNWTLLGLPCVTIPAGRSPTGLPLGVQVVGDYDTDERVLECAEWISQTLL
ncbi:MAG: amidase [Pseudomonadota bacterium]